jgi:hypothetical protein
MKRFLRVTEEAAFGTYNAAGAAVYPRLSSSGAFALMQKPEYWTIMDGSGLGVQALAGTQTMALAGALVTEMGPTLAAFVMPFACNRINSGQTLPWVTTEAVNDLASATFDYARSNFDMSLRRKRYLGCKAASLGLACSRDQPKLMATLGLIGGTMQGNAYDSSADPDATAFPEPTCTEAPQDVYLFQQMSGHVTILGSSRTNFDSFSLQLQNNLKPYFDESHFANAIRMVGRTLTISLRCRLKSTPDDWAAYEQGTVGTASFEFVNGANSMTIAMGAKCYINSIDEEAPIDDEHYYTLTLVNQLDPATCTDFSVTLV